jgi:hypothetical protein
VGAWVHVDRQAEKQTEYKNRQKVTKHMQSFAISSYLGTTDNKLKNVAQLTKPLIRRASRLTCSSHSDTTDTEIKRVIQITKPLPKVYIYVLYSIYTFLYVFTCVT